MYGTRGRIGLITLASDTSVLPEYARLMPDGVAVYPAPIELPRGEVTPAAPAEMLVGDDLERAAALLAWAALGRIGVEDATPGYGRLLALAIAMETITT